MAQYVVFKVTSGSVPAPGSVGSADVYLGDHADMNAAVTAAAVVMNAPPGQFLYAELASTLVRYAVTRATAVG